MAPQSSLQPVVPAQLTAQAQSVAQLTPLQPMAPLHSQLQPITQLQSTFPFQTMVPTQSLTPLQPMAPFNSQAPLQSLIPFQSMVPTQIPAGVQPVPAAAEPLRVPIHNTTGFCGPPFDPLLLEGMRVVQLRELCKNWKIPSSGEKAKLINNLRTHIIYN